MEVSCLSDGRELCGEGLTRYAEMWPAVQNETHQVILRATGRWLVLIKGTQEALTSALRQVWGWEESVNGVAVSRELFAR